MDRVVKLTQEQRKKVIDMAHHLACISTHAPTPCQYSRTEWQLDKMLELCKELTAKIEIIKTELET